MSVGAVIKDESIWLTQKAIANCSGCKLPQSASISRVYLLHEAVVVSKMEIATAHGAMPDKAQTKEARFKERDRWKEVFLKEIATNPDGKPLMFEGKKYRLIGVPLYSNEDENQFLRSCWQIFILSRESHG
ncbi:MAG: hypothetical protein DDT31_01602 [Syntrophomonadaceae bacterium]|nr:hypothetical protein [Bacillota bacterium]